MADRNVRSRASHDNLNGKATVRSGSPWLYFICRTEGSEFVAPCKVGITTKPPRLRLSSIATACPFPVGLYAALAVHKSVIREVERDLHDELSECRLHGEWFDCDGDFAYDVALIMISWYLAHGADTTVTRAADFIFRNSWFAYDTKAEQINRLLEGGR